jgi:hypothetical protein
MTFKAFYEKLEEPVKWYHGTSTKIERFSDEFVGNGVDQNGPGIYFSNNLEDAASYSKKTGNSGFLYEVELNFKKLVPQKGSAKKSEVDSMIRWAEDYETKLMDWGSEELKTNYNLFIKSLKNEENPLEVFQSIWYNLYRYQPIDFVRNMVTLGYDGFIVKRGFMNVSHAIVYNPKIIRVIETF